MSDTSGPRVTRQAVSGESVPDTVACQGQTVPIRCQSLHRASRTAGDDAQRGAGAAARADPRKSPIIGAGAGTGLSAKLAEAGGADLIIIYNSGRYRMAGRGSLSGLLPYGDANAIVVDMAREVLPIVQETPVLAGVCGTDPFRLMDVFLDELRRLGFSGVQNFPTVGLFDGTIRQGLEETGMGYGLEVDMIRLARAKDFLTAPYVFTVEEAVAMAEAGADVLVPHMGLTTGGTIGAESAKTLDDCIPLIQAMRDAATEVNPELIVLCHGGPIAEPDDAAYVIARTTGIVGFFGASSMERLPTETAMTENMRRFKSIPVEKESWHGKPFRDEGRGRDRDVRLGHRGDARRADEHGLRHVCRDGRRARAGLRARLPQAPRPGRDDRRQAGSRRPVARARAPASWALATRSTSTATSCTARTTTPRSLPTSR